MKVVEVKRNIDAPPDKVWAILTDAKLLQSSQLGITRIDGDIAPGSRFKLWAEVSPDRAFSLRVAAYEANRRMVWEGGMPLGLFTGRRQYNLTPSGGGTELHIREEFTGLLSGLIWKSMPDLHPAFNQMADGVKRLAEGSAA